MQFYDKTKSLFLETNASKVGFGAGLLQGRGGMNYGHEKVTGNAKVFLMAFASKRLLIA